MLLNPHVVLLAIFGMWEKTENSLPCRMLAGSWAKVGSRYLGLGFRTQIMNGKWHIFQ